MSSVAPTELADELVRDLPPYRTEPRRFLAEQFDRGLAFPTFAPGLGGLGLGARDAAAVGARTRDAGAPNAFGGNPVGIGMAAPTIARHAATKLAQRLLRPLFVGDEIWCQLFSEPEAGSDLACLVTRAVQDGDEWIIDGQKVWTSLGHVAAWGLLLARTGMPAERSRGLTYFVLDMRAPGVTVRPLRQMTGDAEFNEVFLSAVRVPDDARIGEVGDGWSVARTTLSSERSTLGAPRAAGKGVISHLLRVWGERRSELPPATAACWQDAVVGSWIDSELIRLNALRAAASSELAFVAANPLLSKLAWARSRQSAYALASSLLGAEGMLYPAGYDMVQTEPGVGDNTDVRTGLLRSRANSIEGGSSEILRSVIAERVLGLPRG